MHITVSAIITMKHAVVYIGQHLLSRIFQANVKPTQVTNQPDDNGNTGDGHTIVTYVTSHGEYKKKMLIDSDDVDIDKHADLCFASGYGVQETNPDSTTKLAITK